MKNILQMSEDTVNNLKIKFYFWGFFFIKLLYAVTIFFFVNLKEFPVISHPKKQRNENRKGNFLVYPEF